MRVTFMIPYPQTAQGKKVWNQRYGMNALYAGKHWSQRRVDAQFWHALTISAVNKAGIRKRVMDKPVVISFAYNDRLDCSNHVYMAKMIEDALKGVLIVDDNRRWVVGHEYYFWDGDAIRVTLEEIG